MNREWRLQRELRCGKLTSRFIIIGILEVLVNVGDRVEEDDEVIMLEAMKMENPIYAPSSGIVKEIKVKANDSVDTEQLMMVIE
jgi:acetyl-CoA carboxylase biotin carboxyl carrier protein